MDDFQKKYGSWALVTGANAGIGKAFVNELVVGRQKHSAVNVRGQA